jgi:hypothetical protein
MFDCSNTTDDDFDELVPEAAAAFMATRDGVTDGVFVVFKYLFTLVSAETDALLFAFLTVFRRFYDF